MTKKPRQHIVPHPSGWALEVDNAKKVTKAFGTKREAIELGKSVAKNQKTELVIHKKDGTIQESNSYGNDTFPPRG